VATAVVLHAMAASDATGPAWPEDEIGPLANAKVIAATGRPWSLSHLPYYPGWSVLIAPLWWFSDDPGTVYRAAAVVSVLVAIAAIAPLTALARRVGIDCPSAVAVAAVVTLAPGRTVMSNYVLTENFLVLMVAATAVAGMRYYDRPTVARAVVLAVASAYTFFTHGRAVAIIIATGVAFLIEFRRNRRAATIGLVALVTLSVSAYLAYKGIVGQIYSSGGSREAATIDGLTGNALALLRALVGQLWYQQAAWFALSFVGLGALISLAARELRRRDPRGGSWALLAVAGVVALMTLVLASALEDPSTTSRVDYWLYGRYLEPFLIPLVAVGLAVLVRGIERRHAMVAAGAAVVTSVAFLFLNLPVVDPAKPTAVINVGGLLAWGDAFGSIAQRRVVVVTFMATLALLTLAVLLRRWPRLVLLPLAVALAYGSVTTEREVMDVVNEAWRVDELGPLVAQAVPEGVPIAFDTLNGGRAEENRAAFWLSPRRVEVFDSATEEPPSPWVVARNHWPEGEVLGARRVASGAFPDNALWVMPGPEQEELAARGFLDRQVDG
jgi:hypothetical protein